MLVSRQKDGTWGTLYAYLRVLFVRTEILPQTEFGLRRTQKNNMPWVHVSVFMKNPHDDFDLRLLRKSLRNRK
jgi:hypothetical protein